MRNLMKKISATLLLAVGEIALGILLLVSPSGFTMAVIITVGILFVISGVLNMIGYIRLPREEATQTWKFSAGAAGITIGVLAIVYRSQLLQEFAMLTIIYGFVIMMLAFLKLQITVDALRGRISVWYLMLFSFLATVIISLLLLLNVFHVESTAWLITGICLILIAVLDSVYFILSHRGKKEEDVQLPAEYGR